MERGQIRRTFSPGNEFPYWLTAVTTEDEIVKYEVAQSVDGKIEALVVCIVYSSDDSQCVGSLCIHVANHTQRTQFSICPMDATVIASGEAYLWLGNLSNKKLKLKGGDTVLVHAEFFGTEDDHHFKVKKTGVDVVEFEPLLEVYKIDYEHVAYEYDDTGRSVDWNRAHKNNDTDHEAGLSHHSSDEDQPCKRWRFCFPCFGSANIWQGIWT